MDEDSLQIIASGVRVNLVNSCKDFPTVARLDAENFLNRQTISLLKFNIVRLKLITNLWKSGQQRD